MELRKDERFARVLPPVGAEPLNPTMAKKLVINVAPTGAFVKRIQNPNQPYTGKEIAAHVVAAYKAGASVWHVHIRDEQGIPYLTEADKIQEALDLVLDQCPDILLSHSGHVDIFKKGSEGIKPLVEPLLEAGEKRKRNYIHTLVIMPARTGVQDMNEPLLQDIVEYLQGRNIVPEFQIGDYRCINNVKRGLIEHGLLRQPYVMNILSGAHGREVHGPGGKEPWSHIYLMTLLEYLPEGSVTGATIGGRGWLPLTVEAIMLGVDCVRVGMEDTIYMYPHKNEKINHCGQVIQKIANIARELGRDIATPAEARKIVGVKR